MKPTKHQLAVAQRTWETLGPQYDARERLEKAVEAAMAQRGEPNWPETVRVIGVFALVLAFLAYVIVGRG